MPTFAATITLAKPITDVFTFFAIPKNLEQLAPPDTQLQMIDGPDQLSTGAQVTWKGKRMGVPHQITVEVRKYQLNETIEFHQLKGPLKQWTHTQLFRATDEGTELADNIVFEPPGGLLGMVVNEEFIRKDLQESFVFRETTLRGMFG